jgi:hypothetical protein
MIGTTINVPYEPEFEIANVPPDRSSAAKRFSRALSARSAISRLILISRFSSARWMIGATSPSKLTSTAIESPMLRWSRSSDVEAVAVRDGARDLAPQKAEPARHDGVRGAALTFAMWRPRVRVPSPPPQTCRSAGVYAPAVPRSGPFRARSVRERNDSTCC